VTSSKVEDNAVDLSLLVRQLRVRRWWVLGSTLFCAALAVAAFFVMTPKYIASTVLISASNERNSLSGSLSSALGSLGGGLASLAGASLGASDSATEEALAVLRSRQFTEQFISDLHLMPVLYYRKWDAVNGRWKGKEEDWPTPAKAYKFFSKKVEAIAQDKKTGLTVLLIEWKDRQVAADWANELVKRLNLEMRRREIDKAEASVSYLEKELTTTNVVETREAINRLIETQVKDRMLANVTEEYAFRVVDKAMPADQDDPSKPQKLLLFIGGPLLGLVLGIAGVFFYELYRRTS
jgi:uncharacterized protein involved in exopolysaccharide biosynthesis